MSFRCPRAVHSWPGERWQRPEWTTRAQLERSKDTSLNAWGYSWQRPNGPWLPIHPKVFPGKGAESLRLNFNDWVIEKWWEVISIHLSEWAENLADLSGNTEECGLIVKRAGEVWIGKALVSTSPTPTHTRAHTHSHSLTLTEAFLFTSYWFHLFI